MLWVMLKRWRQRRKLRNTPAVGLTVLYGDDGRIVDTRYVWLWQRGWRLVGERTMLRSHAVEIKEPLCALYDDTGRERGRQTVDTILGPGDSLSVTWNVAVLPP